MIQWEHRSYTLHLLPINLISILTSPNSEHVLPDLKIQGKNSAIKLFLQEYFLTHFILCTSQFTLLSFVISLPIPSLETMCQKLLTSHSYELCNTYVATTYLPRVNAWAFLLACHLPQVNTRAFILACSCRWICHVSLNPYIY